MRDVMAATTEVLSCSATKPATIAQWLWRAHRACSQTVRVFEPCTVAHPPRGSAGVLPGQRHVAMNTPPQLFLEHVLDFLAWPGDP